MKMKMNLKKPLILLPFFIFSFDISAQVQLIDSLQKNKRHYNTVRLEENQAPRIDGILSDDCWKSGTWSGGFIQRQPFGGKPATEETFIKVLYDYGNLYVALLCLDKEADKIRIRPDERDMFSGDFAAIAIDSYFDKRTAFEFALTAAGQKLDQKHLGDFELDKNWNAVWKGKVSVNDSSWIAEMMIPFSQLRYHRKDEYVMGLHFSRSINRKSELSNWDYTPKTAPARVFLFGEMHGISDIMHSRQIEFLPYALSSVQRSGVKKTFDPPGVNAGIDAKIGISSNYTLDVTVNPDFGQVEADPSVLNLTSYETFFQEKRPFFLEGNDVFDFSIDGNSVYYSRRIGSPPSFPGSYMSIDVSDIPSYSTIISSAKLIGKNDKGLSVGVLNGVTLEEYGNARLPGEDQVTRIPVAPLTNYFTSRIKKELNEGQTIFGGVVSSVNRFFNDSLTPTLIPGSSQTGGLDFIQYWNKRTYYFEAKTVGSIITGDAAAMLKTQMSHSHRFQRPDAGHIETDSSSTRLAGHGSLLGFGKKGGNFRFNITGQYRTPGLNLNQMGYMTDADIASGTSGISYEMIKPNKIFLDYTAGLVHNAGWSFGGENTLNRTTFSYDSRFRNFWGLKFKYVINYSVLDTRALWGGPALRTDLNRDLTLSINTNTSKDLSATLDFKYSKSGDKISGLRGLESRINWLPGKRIKLNLSAAYSESKNNQQYIRTITAGNTDYLAGLIDRKILEFVFRGDIYITPELSMRYYGSPYYSTGKYTGLKRVADAGADTNESRFEMMDVTYNAENNNYSYLNNGNNVSFANPDFSFLEFRSNFVFRWEYKLGSTIYFVWSNAKTIREDGVNKPGSITSDLFNIGDNVFMIKFNYWFSL